ncbi:cysteinyl leukotriene receptor 1-like [Heterodontus francisci]|uniref:cysteinyl leukotriene receptor 1-like n=1 Tax=Heterodontus francisci TaxID=7792 RepID=UPI00355B7FAA
MVAMATADLLVIITDVIMWRISYYYFPESFLNITPVCSVVAALGYGASDCSVWFTVAFSFDRFVAIRCQKLKTKYCTEKTAAVVPATICILLCLENIPFCFSFEPGAIIDNVPWVRHILVASRVRKGLRGQSKGVNRSDTEMESRRNSVILLFTISGSFILLWLMYVIYFSISNITGINLEDDTHPFYIYGHIGMMLQLLSCCTNTFIYGVTQSKFREQVKNAMKYPLESIIQLIKKQNN